MKKLILILLVINCAVFIRNNSLAQSPHYFKYQAVARDTKGNLLTNKLISIQIQILKGSINGDTVYSELQNDTTNAFGLINLQIGNGKSL